MGLPTPTALFLLVFPALARVDLRPPVDQQPSQFDVDTSTRFAERLAQNLRLDERIASAVAEARRQDPELFELFYHPPMMNYTESMRARFRHYTGRDIPVERSTSYTIIPQADGNHGHKVGYLKIHRDDGSPADKDKMCSDACTATPGCEYWVRQTEGDDCKLEQKYRGAPHSGHRRTGISNNDSAKCTLARVVAKKVDKILSQDGLNVELPNDFGCVVAEHETSKTFLMNFQKLDIKVQQAFNMTIDDFVTETLLDKKHPHTYLVNLTVFMRFSVDAATSWDDWKVKKADVEIRQAHIGLTLPAFLGHIISGDHYAAMKQDNTCDAAIPAYAANDIKGYTIAHIKLAGLEQTAANQVCCTECEGNPQCGGFVIKRKDGTKTHDCYLKRVYKEEHHYHFNYKGQKSSLMDEIKGEGHEVGYIELPGHNTFQQDDLDKMCANACTEAPECQFWTTTTHDDSHPKCWLEKAYEQDNSLVQSVMRDIMHGQLSKLAKGGLGQLMAHMKAKCNAGKC